jgi:hypothetical protein
VKVIDNTTGEIIDDEGFVSIEEAEAVLFGSIGSELDSKLAQVRVLLRIQELGLYRQKIDDDGHSYPSMIAYLKSLEPQLAAIGAGKSRSLLSWMSRHKIFCSQLNKPESFLRSMGAHAELLLPAAARHDATSQLLDEDVPLAGGGIRLGKARFTELTDFIEERVKESKSGIPEDRWTVKDTADTVREWMEKEQQETAKLHIEAKWVGDKVKMTDLTWWIGDFAYRATDLVPVNHFKLMSKSVVVQGLGDDWRAG